MELTLLGIVGVGAFLLGGGAVLLVSAFRRTIELRTALLHAIKRIERLELALAGRASLPEGFPLAVAAAPSSGEFSAEIRNEIDAGDTLAPPHLGVICTAALLASAAALTAGHLRMLSAQGGMVLALIVGVLVIALAEWRRRADPAPRSWRDQAALGALAGLAIMAGAVLDGRWALGALHPPAALFAAAVLALASAMLAARHGFTLLLFSLIAAILAPNMAPIGGDGAWAHYAFLFAYTALMFAVSRRRKAPVWAWLAFANALFWGVNAAVIGGAALAMASAGLYLAALAALGFVYAWDAPDARPEAPPPFPRFWAAPWREAMMAGHVVAFVAAASLAALVIAHPAPIAYAGAGLAGLSAFAVAAGAMRLRLWLAAPIAVVAVSAGLACLRTDAGAPDAPGLMALAAALAMLFSLGGWAGMTQAKDPRPGAHLAALAPLFLFLAAHARIGGFGAPIAWAGAAVMIAAIDLVCYSQLRRARPTSAGPTSAGPFAAASLLAASAAIAIVTPAPYAPLALAAMLPLAAALDLARNEPGLRLAAIALCAVLFACLITPELFIASASDQGRLALLFLGAAGASALACIAFMFGPAKRGGETSQAVEAFAWLLVAAWATLAARRGFTGGDIGAPYASLGEAGLNTLVWLGLALVLARRLGPRPTPFPAALEFIAFAGALTHALVTCAALLNPWWGLAPAAAPGWRGFNLIEFAYVAPALLFLLYAQMRARHGLTARADTALAAALTLLFLGTLLEVRRLFHGAAMAAAVVTGEEAWAYSAALLGLAGLLLALAASRASRALRYVSLAAAMLALGKMAFSDLLSLSGAGRVGAFAIIAIAAIALGFLYRLYVLPAAPARLKTAAEPAAGASN